MEFEEMKKIWDSQNKQPMYAIDEKSLHNIVKRKIKAAARKVNTFEYGMIAITTFVTVFMIVDGILDQDWTNYVTALAAFGITIYVVIHRGRRRRIENRFGQSLIEGLENAIANIDYLIKQGSSFVWWYILPFAVVSMISMINNPSSIWRWILITGAFILAYLLANWEVRKMHLPRKKSLEALRNTLTQDQDYADLR